MNIYKNVTVSLIATSCSCMCRHCYASATRSVKSSIDREKAGFILDKLQGLFRKSDETLVDIYYDLFDHPDAAGMVRLLYERDLYGFFVDIPTNGGGIALNPEYRNLLSNMKEMGSEFLQLTIHGLPATHDWFVRRKGAFADLIKAANAGRDAGLQLNMIVFMNKRNVDELDKLASVLKREGVAMSGKRAFGAFCWRPIGYAAEIGNLRPDIKDMDKALPYFSKSTLQAHKSECSWAEIAVSGDHQMFYLSADSRIDLIINGDFNIFCSHDNSFVGNLRDDTVTQIEAKFAAIPNENKELGIEMENNGHSESLIALAREFADFKSDVLFSGRSMPLVWLLRKKNMIHAD